MGKLKSISQLQKEIKDIEKKKAEERKRRELEEKLGRLKAKPKTDIRFKIRRRLGGRISGALDKVTGQFFE